MGETVELMLEGLLCQECLSWVEDLEAVGYPRTCKDCIESEGEDDA